MGRLRIYFKPIWYNIMHHKAYAGFCVFGTMLTFVFVTVVMQIAYVVKGNTPPALAGERIVAIPQLLEDEHGRVGRGIRRADIQTMVSNIREDISYTCHHNESIEVSVNRKYNSYKTLFVDENYWNVFQFEFLHGHPFTEQEMKMPCAIVSERFVRTFFPNEDVIDKEIRFQRGIYKITGVVKEVSLFAQEGDASLWVPEKFCKYSNGNDWVNTYILYPENVSSQSITKSVTNAFNLFTRMKYKFEGSTTLKKIRTVKENMQHRYGGDLLLIGVFGIVFILLIIPVLNFILLSMANTRLQAGEIGLKRALGADQVRTFLYVLTENFLLITFGALLGIVLTAPICRGMDAILFSSRGIHDLTIFSGLDWEVMFIGVLPSFLLFLLLAGGIPAYWMVKRPIVDLLKGGARC